MNDPSLKCKTRNLNKLAELEIVSLNGVRHQFDNCIGLIKHIYKPAVRIDLKHDFWSILGHITYLARGFRSFIANMDNTNATPVATGTVKQPFTDCTPNNNVNIVYFVSLKIGETIKTFSMLKDFPRNGILSL